MDEDRLRCDGCGRSVRGGREGCRADFDELLARDFSDPRFFASHRLFVDTYSLQHPDQFCRSAKSLAMHLVRLFCAVDNEAGAAAGSEALRRWLDGSGRLERPEVPRWRGRLTLGDLPADTGPAEWADALKAWALATWEAYGSLHPLARTWLLEAKSS